MAALMTPIAVAAREEELLGKIPHIDQELQPPKPPERERALLNIPRVLRIIPQIIRTLRPLSLLAEDITNGPSAQDISARSPVVAHESSTPRQSFDSKITRSPHRSAIKSNQFDRPEPTDEERFEDVGLNDETKPPAPKKKSIFSRFGDNSEPPTLGDVPRPTSSHRGFHLPGRKRGQSGQGAELGNIDRSDTNGDDDGVVR